MANKQGNATAQSLPQDRELPALFKKFEQDYVRMEYHGPDEAPLYYLEGDADKAMADLQRIADVATAIGRAEAEDEFYKKYGRCSYCGDEGAITHFIDDYENQGRAETK